MSIPELKKPAKSLTWMDRDDHLEARECCGMVLRDVFIWSAVLSLRVPDGALKISIAKDISEIIWQVKKDDLTAMQMMLDLRDRLIRGDSPYAYIAQNYQQQNERKGIINSWLRNEIEAELTSEEFPSLVLKESLIHHLDSPFIDFDLIQTVVRRLSVGTLDAGALRSFICAAKSMNEMSEFEQDCAKKMYYVKVISALREDREVSVKKLINPHQLRARWMDGVGGYCAAFSEIESFLKNIESWHEGSIDPRESSNGTKRWIAESFLGLVRFCGGEVQIIEWAADKLGISPPNTTVINSCWKLRELIKELGATYVEILSCYDEPIVEQHLIACNNALASSHQFIRNAIYIASSWLCEGNEGDRVLVVHHDERSAMQIRSQHGTMDLWTGRIIHEKEDESSLIVRRSTIFGATHEENVDGHFEDAEGIENVDGDYLDAMSLEEEENIDAPHVEDTKVYTLNETGGNESGLSGNTRLQEFRRISNELEKFVKGQKSACNQMALSILAHQLEQRQGGVLIRGPSGSGKTHLISCASRVMGNLPVVHASAPALVPEGIRGLTISHLFLQLFEMSGRKIDVAQRGILVLDEFDKISASGDNLSATMNNLLRVMDGCIWNLGHTEDRMPIQSFDTSKIMIILCGAWQSVERNIGVIGFNNCGNEKSGSERLGLPDEMQGRISRIIHLGDLSHDALVQILEDKIGPWKNARELLGDSYVPSPSINQDLAKAAIASGLGARYLQRKINDIVEERFLNV